LPAVGLALVAASCGRLGMGPRRAFIGGAVVVLARRRPLATLRPRFGVGLPARRAARLPRRRAVTGGGHPGHRAEALLGRQRRPARGVSPLCRRDWAGAPTGPPLRPQFAASFSSRVPAVRPPYSDPWLIPAWVHAKEGADVWADDEELVALAYQRFLLQLGFADRLLGELLEQLRSRGLYERALIVVTADHGIVHCPGHARRGAPGEDLRAELMPVPHFVKLPAQRAGAVRDDVAETIDVLPTVADVLGVEVPWAIDGRSLLAPGLRRSRQRFVVRGGDDGREEVQIYDPDDELKYRVSEHWLAIFGSGRTNPAGLFRFGAGRALVGRPLADFDVVAGQGWSVAWRAPGRYAAVDPAADPVPVHLVATLEGPPGVLPPRRWAIVVNGVVRAVVPAFRAPDGTFRLDAVVSENALRPGANELAAFFLEGDDGDAPKFHLALPRDSAAAARQIYESLPEMLFTTAAGFDALVPTTGWATTTAGALQLAGEPVAPQLTFTVPGLRGRHRAGLRVDVESPADSRVCVSYQTVEEPRFRWTRRRCEAILAGRREVFLAIEDHDLNGVLRLELGGVPGDYVLRALMVRGAANAVGSGSPGGDHAMGKDDRSLLPLERWQAQLPALAERYRSNRPTPHVHLVDFLDPATARAVAAAFPRPEDTAWIQYQHYNERKLGKTDRDAFPPLIGRLVDELNSAPFVAWLEALTGIRGLIPDPALEGGGMHQSERGGFLNVHADFTMHHHHTDWHRRCNLILYLNEGWQESWGGALELWDAKMQRCEVRVPPLLNHAVIFNTTETSFHGFPEPLRCPPGETRKSLALYYYTRERRPHRARPTDYRARPGDGWKRLPIWLDKKAVALYSAIKRRFGLSDDFASRLLGWLARRRR